MWTENIETSGPYDFERVLDRLSLDPINSIDKQRRKLKMRFVINDKPYIIHVRGAGSVDFPLFEINGRDKRVKEQALQKVKKVLQLDFPLLPMHTHFTKTNIAEIFQQHIGTPLVIEFDLYSCLIKCIIHQQLNVAFAHTLTERFVMNFGYQIEGVWFYPLPERVAELTYDELKKLQFSGKKAEYVIDTSRLIAEGKLKLDNLEFLSDEEVIKNLTKIRGIGPWTAQNLLLSGLGRPNLFPKTDVGIQKAVQKHFNLDKKPGIEEMDSLSEDWSPYLSYAALYLWRSIE